MPALHGQTLAKKKTGEYEVVAYAKIMETFESSGPPIVDELGSSVCGTMTQTVRGERSAMKRRVYESREAWCFIRPRGPDTQIAPGEKSPEKTVEKCFH